MNISVPIAPRGTASAPSPEPAARPPARLATALRALIWKDLRRTFPLVLVILAILVLLAMIPYLVHLLNPQATRDPNQPNILALWQFFELIPFLAAFVGIGLGIALARDSAGSDRWAFLMHRPLSRPRLFLGRLIAAVILYAVAAGVPAALLIVYAAMSFDIPFHPAMTLPVVADVAAGFLYLLVGMLIVERRAFIAVRFVPVVAAVLVSTIVLHVSTFGAAALTISLAGILFVLAAMGAHITDGNALRAPAPARAATSLILLTGISTVLLLLGMMAKSILQDRARDAALNLLVLRPPQIVTTFSFLPDGTVGRNVMHMGFRIDKSTGLQTNPSGVQFPQYLPLDSDTPPNPPVTGDAMERLKSDSALLNYANFQNSYRNDPPRGVPAPVPAPGSDYELWYAIPAARVLRGYDSATHELLGTIGVDGFAPPGKSARGFTYVEPGPRGLYIGPRGLYHINLKNRTTYLAYELPAGMTAHGVGDIDPSRPSDGNGSFLVLTGDRVLIYNASRYLLPAEASAPLQVATALMLDHKSNHIEVTRFDASDARGGRWGIAYSDAAYNSQNNGDWDTLYNPQTFDLFDAGGKRIDHHQFPTGAVSVPPPPPASPHLPTIRHEYFLATALVDAITSLPAFEIIHRIVNRDEAADRGTLAVLEGRALPPNAEPWYALPAGCALLLCAGGMAWLVRRYRARHAMLWSVAAFLAGPAMPLTFICTHARPWREPCPSCGRKRTVLETRCVRCGAEYPLPASQGIEIFT